MVRLTPILAGMILAACSATSDTGFESQTEHKDQDSIIEVTTADGPEFVEIYKDQNGTIRYFLSGGSQIHGVYQYGSIAKYACALAAVKLHANDTISLDDTVSELLPDYEGAGGDLITLRHLLQNRSGLEPALNSALKEEPELSAQSMEVTQAANRFAGTTPTFEPGTQYEYLNENWILAQAVLENATGKSIEAILTEQVFNPAGMKSAEVFEGEPSGDGLVQGIAPPVPNYMGCASGIAGTAADLTALLQYPFKDGVLSSEAMFDFTHIVTPAQAYALGGRYENMSVNDNQYRISTQSGASGDYRAMGLHDPETEETLVILSSDPDITPLIERRNAWMLAGNRTLVPR